MANFMKNAVYVLFVLGFIASIILGVIGKSFLYAIVGCVSTFISFIPWFLLVEISDKIDVLSSRISNIETDLEYALSENGDSEAEPSSAPIVPISKDGKWTCPKCKEANSSSQRTCKSCGYTR